MTRVIGLTGGIGTGKSRVAKFFEALGARVIDADAIVHELQRPGSAVLAQMVEAFGAGILDAAGELDRAALGARVFRDPEARARLNAIVWPPVVAEIARRTEQARTAGVPLVVLDIPLLFESRGKRSAQRAAGERSPQDAGAQPASGARSEPKANGVPKLAGERSPQDARANAFDAVVVVYAPEALQIERQMARDGCAREEAEHRVRAQIPIEEKRQLADYVIDNGGSLEDTERQVRALYRKLTGGRAAAP